MELPRTAALRLRRAGSVFIVHIIHQPTVSGRIVYKAVSWIPITSRPAGFLEIVCNGFGHGVMDYETYICFIDAHAKRNGGADDFDIACHPRALHLVLLIFGHLSMVIPCLETKRQSQLFRYG